MSFLNYNGYQPGETAELHLVPTRERPWVIPSLPDEIPAERPSERVKPEVRKSWIRPKKPKPKKASGYEKKHLSTAKLLKDQDKRT